MAAPNIKSIAASLRNCSLNGGRTAAPLHQSPPEMAESQQLTVEFNSDSAFPNHRKQCLDIKTGKLFYVNWKSGEKRTDISFTAASEVHSSCNSSEENTEDEEDNDGDVEDSSSLAGDGTDCEDFFGINSGNSDSFSSTDSDTGGESGGGERDLILVVAGCKSCFMYFMVPKRVDSCPKCGGCLLHFS